MFYQIDTIISGSESWFFTQILFMEAYPCLLVPFLNCYFYVPLSDYSIVLKARHDESTHELITLHNHELIQR